jgi:predicted FMN-binding regulatory protein PaiB
LRIRAIGSFDSHGNTAVYEFLCEAPKKPRGIETRTRVPTWNYVVVQARGTPRVFDDTSWIRAQVQHLTATQEHKRAIPWNVNDAPEPFIAGPLKQGADYN